MKGVKQRTAPRRAGRLKACGRNILDASRPGNIRRQMVLPRKRRRIKIADVHSFYVRRPEASICKAGRNGFHGQIFQAAVGKSPKGGLAHSRHVDSSHIIQS